MLLTVGWLAALLLDETSRRPLVENVWSRYLLCLPGTFLTAWALLLEMRRFRAMGLRSTTRDLVIAAATFVAYGVLAGLIVRKADFFPASLLNYETFTSLTGLAVRIFRAICAVVAAFPCGESLVDHCRQALLGQKFAAAAEQPIGLYQIAKRTMSVFADSALRRKLTIAMKNMDAVPLLTVSPREVEQIFYHLIQRAIDAADGRAEQKLTISCSVDERCIELLFCDTCGRRKADCCGSRRADYR